MEIRFVRGADGDIYMLRYERILDAMIAGFKNPLGGGFKYFLFSRLFGGDDPIWLAHIFQMGWFNHQLVLIVTVNSIELYYVITPKKKTKKNKTKHVTVTRERDYPFHVFDFYNKKLGGGFKDVFF